MIKVKFKHDIKNKFIIKEFNNLDEYLYWIFGEEGSWYGLDEVLSGQEIITGEIKQKGINNK